MASSLNEKLKYKRSSRDPTKFDINELLSRLDDNNGKCRGCRKKVPWSRERVSSHKRATCTAASESEKDFFKPILKQKRERTEVNRIVVNDSPKEQETVSVQIPPPSPAKRPKQRTIAKAAVTTWVDSLTDAERARITEALANFVFRTGIPFRVVESEAMKELLQALRPAYVPFAPSAKTLSGSLLTKRYGYLFSKGISLVAGATTYTISSDGWSDLNGDHMVNYVVLIPGKKPFLFRTKSTVGILQTSEVIAAEILQVVYELGVEKCVGIVTDNAPSMRGAWNIIMQKHPHIFANGCAAHVMNLLIKAICSIAVFSDILKKAATVVSFIKEHGFVAAAFKKLRKRFKVKAGLKTIVPTRWYSQYNQCYSLLFAKYAVFSLLESEYASTLAAIKNQERVTEFREIVGNTDFWAGLHKLKGVLEFPSKIIGKFESDSGDLFMVYDYFRRLEVSWSISSDFSPALSAELLSIAKKRWEFLSTDSIAFAYMLTPKSHERTWRPKEKLNTKKQLKAYIDMFYAGDKDSIVKCKAELDDFLTMLVYVETEEKEEFLSLGGLAYRGQYGYKAYPSLFRIAIRVFAVPTSSAASERVWSIYSFLMTKRRNRLAFEKLERVAFIYINSCLLDDVDCRDYLAEDVDEDIDSDSDEESGAEKEDDGEVIVIT